MASKDVMPQNSPLYVPTPHSYRNIQWCSVICEAPRDVLENYLQEPLEMPQGETLPFEAFVAYYGQSEIGGYNEAGLIIPANYKEIQASHFSNLYLDSDAGIAAGREIIGFPKKHADVYYHELKDHVTGAVVRKGSPIISISGDFSEPVEVERLPVAPRLQVRYIPKVDGPGADIHQVIATRWPPDKGSQTVKVHERKTGRGKVIFGSNGEDDFSQLNNAKVLGAVKVHLDFTLEYATVVDNL